MELPKSVDAAASHIRQIERSRACPPHAVRAQRELLVEVNVWARVALAAWETGGEQGFGQRRNARHPRRLAIQLRSTPAFGCKELVAHGIVNHSGHERTIGLRLDAFGPVLEPHGNAELRESVRKVGGSVERVHVPAILASEPLARAFFAEDAVLGKSLAQPAADQLLHGAVGHRHQVHIAFVLSFDALNKVLAQPRPGLARNLRRLGNKCLDCRLRHARHRAASPDPASAGPGASAIS